MKYSDGFKSNMIRRMADPEGLSASALSQEMGIPQQTLSRWLQDASVANDLNSTSIPGELEHKVRQLRPQDRTPEEKLRMVAEAESMPEDQIGAFLRRNAIHDAQLCDWCNLMLNGLQQSVRPHPKSPVETLMIRTLKMELSRKDKALAEAAAILLLQKKVQSIWAEEDAPTRKRSAK